MNSFVKKAPFTSYLGRPNTSNPKMPYNNPETLNYAIGDKVSWQDQNSSQQSGIVTNIGYYGLDVIQDFEEVFVPFEQITKEI